MTIIYIYIAKPSKIKSCVPSLLPKIKNEKGKGHGSYHVKGPRLVDLIGSCMMHVFAKLCAFNYNLVLNEVTLH